MKPLKRKLTTTFVALGLLGLMVIGVTGYTLTQWRASEEEQRRHYTRSLRLQEVRALTFEAYKEVPDAVIGGDPDARQDYERRLAPIDDAFEEWASLAEDDAEVAEVAEVRMAAEQLQQSASRVFDLVEAEQIDIAISELESVEETVFEPFDALTTAAVLADRAKRDVVRAEAADARRTANTALVVAALGIVSLLFLVGAYLGGGVFGPVRRLHGAMGRLERGDTDVRLSEDGDDEIAQVNREFNRLAARLRDQADPAVRPGDDAATDARLVLDRMLDGLRDEATALQSFLVDDRALLAGASLVAKIEATQVALDRIGALAQPVDLDLAPVDPMNLLHEVMDRFGDEIIRQRVNTSIDVDPSLTTSILDRARVRETLSELVRNALDALPEQGGTLRLRACPVENTWVAFEVEDDGSGFTDEDLAWLYDGSKRPSDTRGVGLRLATSIVEQHGGRLQLESLDNNGTIARVLLQRQDPSDRRTNPS